MKKASKRNRGQRRAWAAKKDRATRKARRAMHEALIMGARAGLVSDTYYQETGAYVDTYTQIEIVRS